MHYQIELQLVKLADGSRILRIADPASGLALEKVLDPKRPLAAQKHALAQSLRAAIERELALTK